MRSVGFPMLRATVRPGRLAGYWLSGTACRRCLLKSVDRQGSYRERKNCMTLKSSSLSVAPPAELLGLSRSQVHILPQAYDRIGAGGLVSKKRGRLSNGRYSEDFRASKISRYLWADYGLDQRRPTEKFILAHLNFPAVRMKELYIKEMSAPRDEVLRSEKVILMGRRI